MPMAQAADSKVDAHTTEYVVVNKGVKELPAELAKTLKAVTLPPLAGKGHVYIWTRI